MTQIFFVGSNELPGKWFLAIDDISFSKELCKQIPLKKDEGETRNVTFNFLHVIHGFLKLKTPISKYNM